MVSFSFYFFEQKSNLEMRTMDHCNIILNIYMHTCQVLRFRRSHYGFLEKLKTTAVVRNDYGFTLGWDVFFW